MTMGYNARGQHRMVLVNDRDYPRVPVQPQTRHLGGRGSCYERHGHPMKNGTTKGPMRDAVHRNPFARQTRPERAMTIYVNYAAGADGR